MIHTVVRENNDTFDYCIYDLDNYNSIPDPHVRCGFVFDGNYYVVLGKISDPSGQSNFPIGYKISLDSYLIQPLGIAISSQSDEEFVQAGVSGSFDMPFDNPGFVYNKDGKSWLVTVAKTGSNGYVFVKMGLSSDINGYTIIKKITGTSLSMSIIGPVLVSDKLVFLTKNVSDGAFVDKIHLYDIETFTNESLEVTTNLLGEHSLASFRDSVYIIGGREFVGDSVQNIKNKIFKIDTFSPTDIIETQLLSTSTILPNTLLNPPIAQESNRAYIISNAPDNAMYMIDLDANSVTRQPLYDGSVIGLTSFIYNNRVFAFDTNTLRLISEESLGRSYLTTSYNIQFVVSDPIQNISVPYYEYVYNNKSKDVVGMKTVINNITLQ